MVLRVLHIVGVMNMGGIENLLMNIYRKIDRERIQFDFLVTREQKGIFDQEIEMLGGKVYNIPSITEVGYYHHTKSLYQFFTSNPQYKIVHCHRDALNALYLRQAKKANIPIRIGHSHTTRARVPFSFKQLPEKIIKQYFRLFSGKYATHFFACGEAAGKWLFGKKIYTNDTIIVNNGIDLNRYIYDKHERERIRKSLGIDEKTLVLGHIGSFMKGKNHKFIIDLFSQLKTKIPDSKLLLVGDGGLKTEIEQYANRKRLSENILFLGIRKDINSLLMAMDIFVFPSFFEGLPISLIEAQSSGVLCLVSDTITQEVIMDKKLINFCSITNKEKWIQEIEKAYNNICDIRINRKSPIKQIRDKGYDIDTTTNFLIEFYLKFKY